MHQNSVQVLLMVSSAYLYQQTNTSYKNIK